MILQIMTPQHGHKELVVEEDVDLAKELFHKALAGGAMAYRVGTDPKDKEVIHNLDEVTPETQRVVVRAPMVGG